MLGCFPACCRLLKSMLHTIPWSSLLCANFYTGLARTFKLFVSFFVDSFLFSGELDIRCDQADEI